MGGGSQASPSNDVVSLPRDCQSTALDLVEGFPSILKCLMCVHISYFIYGDIDIHCKGCAHR